MYFWEVNQTNVGNSTFDYVSYMSSKWKQKMILEFLCRQFFAFIYQLLKHFSGFLFYIVKSQWRNSADYTEYSDDQNQLNQVLTLSHLLVGCFFYFWSFVQRFEHFWWGSVQTNKQNVNDESFKKFYRFYWWLRLYFGVDYHFWIKTSNDVWNNLIFQKSKCLLF